MENIFLKYVKDYDLEKHRFYTFFKKANQEEFLRSQKSFYYAVKEFPKMLCNLAIKIDNPQTRKSVIENLWEEHGHGNSNNFHTQTFLDYLHILGMDENEKITENSYVTKWIRSSLELQMSASQYALYLSAIEFIYARISQHICVNLKRFNLEKKSHHYSKHETLDFEHGQELLDVAFESFNKDDDIYQSMQNQWIFKQSIKDFLYMLDEMTFLTQKEIEEISQEKISFYYTREDSSIETTYAKDKKNILCISSGGEHVINIRKINSKAHITALDINSYQLDLTRKKIEGLSHKINQYNLGNNGKFEKMFSYLSSRLSIDDLSGIANEDKEALKKLHRLCTELFSNQTLEIIFTNQATCYSHPHGFIEHFYHVFKNQIKNHILNPLKQSNIGSILGKTLPINYPESINVDQIDYFHGTIENYFMNYPYAYIDMIDISNIGDWMSVENYKKLIKLIDTHLLPGGIIVARKLLGNYDLREILKIFRVNSIHDNTDFYTQCVVAQK